MKCNMCRGEATFKDVDPYYDQLLLEEGEESEEYWWCEDYFQDRLYAI